MKNIDTIIRELAELTIRARHQVDSSHIISIKMYIYPDTPPTAVITYDDPNEPKDVYCLGATVPYDMLVDGDTF